MGWMSTQQETLRSSYEMASHFYSLHKHDRLNDMLCRGGGKNPLQSRTRPKEKSLCVDGNCPHHRLPITSFFYINSMKFTILFLVLASFASYRNLIFHLEHENHEGVAKWSVTMVVFIIATIFVLFA